MTGHLWKKYPEGSRIGRRKRWLALLLSLSLVGTMLPIPARAEEEGTGAGTGLCGHHTEHTADCGYVEAVEGQACEHTHDDGCGYQEASDCTHVHTEECGENGETCTHVHDDTCGYAEGHACGHIHDESCGYVESVEGSPCTFVCDTCQAESGSEEGENTLSQTALAVQALIDALPTAEDITEENLEAVSGMLDEIDTAREALTDEEREAVDFTKYDAAAAKMMELMGQAGAGDVAVMALSGFAMTGKPADTTVRSINLNAAALRPESTWRSGGKLVYFGRYNSNPVEYRVLSSPNTQTGVDNCLLLDCDTILGTMAFSSDGSNHWKDDNCTVRNWMNGTAFYGNPVFSSIEQTAIAKTTLEAQSQYIVVAAGWLDNEFQDDSAANDVFCLSAAEADGLYADDNARKKTGGNAEWWLRSVYSGPSAFSSVGSVDKDGTVGVWGADQSDGGVSPAFNLKLSSILFASESGMNKASALAAVSGSTAAKWKLTLRDGGKTVNVKDGQSVTKTDTGASEIITVPYTYTDTNSAKPVNQISVMITDKAYDTDSAQILYYGALQGVTISDTTGTGTFTLPTELADKTCGTGYHAYIVAENVNGGNVTDYASAPAAITIPPKKYTVTVTNGTLEGGSTTGDYAKGETVTITAGAAPKGQQFKEWKVVSGSIALAGSTSETTTFIMPAEAVSVQAVYENSANPGGGSGNHGGGSGNQGGGSGNAGSGSDNQGSGSGNAGSTSDNAGSGSNDSGTPGSPYTTYQIINGADSSWIMGSSEGLTIRGNGDFGRFTGVKVDGALLDRSHYTAREGSTIITLKASHLNTLAAGTHTFEILWTDGSAVTAFTICADASAKDGNDQNSSTDSALTGGRGRKDDVPETGESTPAAWLFTLALLSGTGLLLTGRKGRIGRH